MKIKSLYLAGAMAAVIMTTSCSSKKQITYFQDLKPGQELVIANLSPIKLQPNDKVSIVVSTGDSRLNSLFNLPVARTNISQGNSNGKINSGGSESTSPYTLDSQGDINFPVLGKLHVAGMTREELGEYIRRELISRDLAKNPIVTVEYLNLSVTVLGEVGHPGRFAIDYGIDGCLVKFQLDTGSDLHHDCGVAYVSDLAVDTACGHHAVTFLHGLALTLEFLLFL